MAQSVYVSAKSVSVCAKMVAKFSNALNEDCLFNCEDHVDFHKINALGTLKQTMSFIYYLTITNG